MAIKLIIGLRNPGNDYEKTRHNAGGWFVESLVETHHAVFKTEKKLHCELANLSFEGLACKAALPLTFMNHSGLPSREITQFYRIEPHEILVVHDELDLSPGRIKLKIGGGHGGHNGLRDITTQLGTGDFNRLRIGIGHPGHKDKVLNYVLGKPNSKDKELIDEAINRGITLMPEILKGNMEISMSLLNC